jgi:hypothetical protein
LAIALWIVMVPHLVRQCRRQRQLSLDAMIAIAGLTSYWLDSAINFFQPIWFYSSNWTNVASWTGHMPFVVNPVAGRLPTPIIFISTVYTFGLLLAAKAANALMGYLRSRWPAISTARLVMAAMACGLVADALIESPMYYLHLFGYPGAPSWMSLTGGGSTKYPFAELIVAAIGPFTVLAYVRFNKDDSGMTILERGWSGSTRRRRWLSLLATIGLLNLIVFCSDAALSLTGPYADARSYQNYPAHLVNGACGAGTSYGACPGQPGYRMPVRHLPFASPGSRA